MNFDEACGSETSQECDDHEPLEFTNMTYISTRLTYTALLCQHTAVMDKLHNFNPIANVVDENIHLTTLVKTQFPQGVRIYLLAYIRQKSSGSNNLTN